MLSKRLKVVLDQPNLVPEYAGWLLKRALKSEGPTRKLFGGIKFGGFANFSEYHMLPHLVEGGDLDFFRSWPLSDGDILDVGANVGVVSLLVADRYHDRRVFAFEPNPSTYETLVGNVRRNRVSNIYCIQTAIGDRDGYVAFDADPIKRGTAAISRGRGENDLMVPVRTLDTFVASQEIAKIALLKVDVEGFEEIVFAGGGATLSRLRPKLIFFEVCPELTATRGFAPDAAARRLVEFGYQLYRPGRGRSWLPATLAELNSVGLENWLAVPK